MKIRTSFFSLNPEIIDFIKQYYIFIIAFLLLVVMLFILYSLKTNKKSIKINYMNKTYTRQIVLNTKKGTFSYLNLKNPNETKSKPISDFYSTFSMKDQDDVKEWVTSLLEPGKEHNIFFERYVYEKKRRDYIFTTYKCLKANYIDQTVYIEVTIYPSIKKMGVIKTSGNEFVSVSDLSKYAEIQKKKKRKEICIYNIHLYNKNNLIKKDYDNMIHIHLLKLLNRYLSTKDYKNFQYSLYNNSTLCLISNKFKSESTIEKYLNYILDKTYTYFSLHNLHTLFDYRIGVYCNKEFEDELLINKAKKAYQAALFAKESSSKIKHSYYSTEIFETESYNESLLKEALDMIKNNMFTTYYKPFIQIGGGQTQNTRTKGFICSLTPKSKIIENINMLEEILYNADEGYSYVKYLINECTAGFEEQKIKKVTLKNILITIDYPFIKNVLSYFKYNKIDDFSITFLIDENYFLNSDYDILELKNDFNKLRQFGHSIGLNISHYQSQIENNLLTLFDLFVLNSSIIKDYRLETRNTILTKNLVSNLTKTKTPILATGVKNWAEAELLSTFGVNYFAGKFISKKSEDIKEVDKNLAQKMQHKKN